MAVPPVAHPSGIEVCPARPILNVFVRTPDGSIRHLRHRVDFPTPGPGSGLVPRRRGLADGRMLNFSPEGPRRRHASEAELRLKQCVG